MRESFACECQVQIFYAFEHIFLCNREKLMKIRGFSVFRPFTGQSCITIAVLASHPSLRINASLVMYSSLSENTSFQVDCTQRALF